MFQTATEQAKHRRTQLAPLGVDFVRVRPPMPSSNLHGQARTDMESAAAFLVRYWNELCPAGTKVRYYPRWGAWGIYQDQVLERPAKVAADGLPVLFLDNPRGHVSAWHCEPLELAELRDQVGGRR